MEASAEPSAGSPGPRSEEKHTVFSVISMNSHSRTKETTTRVYGAVLLFWLAGEGKEEENDVTKYI